jgi:hypothetical protein
LEAVPALQRFDAGCVTKLFPFDDPQVPITSSLAVQFAVEPPFNPAQIQFHGPVPVSTEVVPALQRFDVGAVGKLFPLAEPQTPFISRFAEHCAVVPPFDPAQAQSHGPFPVTLEAVPAAQSLDVGSVKKLFPFAQPQAPFISSLAAHFAV